MLADIDMAEFRGEDWCLGGQETDCLAIVVFDRQFVACVEV
jgi:hypothetical protein